MSNTADYYCWRRETIKPFLPRHYSKVLEIGCGSGVFRDNLDQEHEYWGVEPVQSIAEIASPKLDRVLVGTYEEVEKQIPADYFDLVICNDVIEHMADHDDFLLSIREKIADGGCMVASIPNVRYVLNLFEVLVLKDWEYKSMGILDQTHLRFFTRKSIVRTIADNGFSIEAIAGINPYKAGSFLKRVLFFLVLPIFGSDIRYLQFCIRVVPEGVAGK